MLNSLNRTSVPPVNPVSTVMKKTGVLQRRKMNVHKHDHHLSNYHNSSGFVKTANSFPVGMSAQLLPADSIR
jgi:hypothetical protein